MAKGGFMGKAKARKLTERQLKVLKDMLMGEKERILNSMSVKTEQIGTGSSETKDSVDEANESILLAHAARFTNRENLYLKKVFKSLKKIEEKTYGQCEECGDNILFTRLSARLTSELCIVCKEESEQEEQQNVFGRKSKSLGRTLTVSRI